MLDPVLLKQVVATARSMKIVLSTRTTITIHSPWR